MSMKENVRNAKLYGKFLEDILWAFGTAEKRIPTHFELAQIRQLAVKMVMQSPNSKVIDARIVDGVVTVNATDESESDQSGQQSFAE